ncbi:MAG: ACP S-malonyltransferase [Myxococcales bacterium]|nr:ACP S-malonyltransferase [Myxococcales bacterium]
MLVVSLFFPGQGSQTPGMGQALTETFPAARQVFEAADDALGFHLSRLCFEGPEEELRRTEITQPAILTTSIATWRAIQTIRPDFRPSVVAGHSLGEWSALVVTGALHFHDAVQLVHTRGRLMQDAVPDGEGAMLAVIGIPAATIETICREVETQTGAILQPANYNSPEQTVVSGHARAVENAETAFTQAGAKKIVRLPVSAPFHCPLMQPAADRLCEALIPVPVGPMQYPVITNVEATPNHDPFRVKALLVQQVTAPVRWVEVVQQAISMGTSQAVEVGPGRVLAGLARRIDRSLKVSPAHDPDSLKKLFE